MGRRRLTTEEFVERAVAVHGDLYDYSETRYTQIRDRVNIFCPQCGQEFEQLAYNHLGGAGCGRCCQSKGESAVKQLLDLLGEEYIEQATFDDCSDIRRLRFDFYLPKRNVLVEYDGVQHYRPVEFFGGYQAFKKRRKRDSIKDKYARQRGMRLLRISTVEHVCLGVVNEVVRDCIAGPASGPSSF